MRRASRLLLLLLLLLLPCTPSAAEAEPEAESEIESESEIEPEPEPEIEPEIESEIEPEIDIEPEPEPDLPPELAALTALEEGRWLDAISAHEQLLASDPLAASAPTWRVALIQANLAEGRIPPALAAAAALQADLSGEWWLAHEDEGAVRAEALANQEAALLMLANHCRDVARDHPQDAAELFDLAVTWYGVLADRADGGEHAQEALLEMARVHYATGQFDEAYTRAVQAADENPGTLRSRLACELAVYASRRLDRGDEASRDRQVEALDRFVALFPHDFMTQDMLFQSAQLLLDGGAVGAAEPRLKRVVEIGPATPTAHRAGELLVEALSNERQWAALSTACVELLAEDSFGTPQLRRELRTARDRAAFHLIEDEHVQAEDWLGAAEAFQRFSEDYPDSTLADRALYNAIVFYYKAGRSRVAANLVNVLRRRFPASPYIDRLQL